MYIKSESANRLKVIYFPSRKMKFSFTGFFAREIILPGWTNLKRPMHQNLFTFYGFQDTRYGTQSKVANRPKIAFDTTVRKFNSLSVSDIIL